MKLREGQINNKNMATGIKDELTLEERERLLNLANILQSAYIARKSSEPIELLNNQETLAARFKELLIEKLPGLELRESVSRKIEKWKKAADSGIYSPEEINQYIREEIEREARLYIDSSPHIQMYNRIYIEDKLVEDLDKIASTEKIEVLDLYKVAKIAFDLNGLKTLNDAAGHESGNNALEIFSKILKEGETSKWLREQKIDVIPAHQSGDEFILLIYGEKDLSGITEEIKKRYEEEVKGFEAADLLDFQTAKNYLVGLKIYDKFLEGIVEGDGIEIKDLSEDKLAKKKESLEKSFKEIFRFKLGTSVGIVTLGEALYEINPDKINNEDYRGISRALIGKMFKMADEKAIAHKKESKAKLALVDPLLAILYNRSVTSTDKDNSEELANLTLKNSRLEKENAEFKARMALLEKQNVQR